MIFGAVDRVASAFGSIKSHSLDKGFWSPAVPAGLKERMDLVVLPKMGRRNKAEAARELDQGIRRRPPQASCDQVGHQRTGAARAVPDLLLRCGRLCLDDRSWHLRDQSRSPRQDDTRQGGRATTKAKTPTPTNHRVLPTHSRLNASTGGEVCTAFYKSTNLACSARFSAEIRHHSRDLAVETSKLRAENQSEIVIDNWIGWGFRAGARLDPRRSRYHEVCRHGRHHFLSRLDADKVQDQNADVVLELC